MTTVICVRFIITYWLNVHALEALCSLNYIFFLWETRPPLLQPLPFAFFILHYLRMCYQISPAKPPPNEITEIRVDVMTKKSSSYFSLWPPFGAIHKLWFVFNTHYHTSAIVSRSLYIFNPVFELQSNLFSVFFRKLLLLLFKSGL